MLELYQYELSDTWPQDLDANGRYGYDLARHRLGDRFHAHVAIKGTQYAGFALVAPAVVTRSEGCWMEQFFVLKRFRRAGVGFELARHVFFDHPGPWEVGQMPANLAAQVFWRKVIDQMTDGQFTEVKVTQGWWQGVVQQFHIRAADDDDPVRAAPPLLTFRALVPADQERLWHWLHVALWDPPPAPPRPLEVLQSPGARIYAEDWGRPTDIGVVAVVDGVDAGACWMRLLPPGTGLASVDATTPQLGIALEPAYQHRGSGKPLLLEALSRAAKAGHRQVALTVHPDNPARLMYRSCGFEQLEVRNNYWLMLAHLPCRDS